MSAPHTDPAARVSTPPQPPITPIDLAAERAQLGPALLGAVERVLASGRY